MNGLLVEVTDDGRGGADPAAGSGLRGLDDRVSAIGGRLTVTSPADGGTTIRAELPIHASAEVVMPATDATLIDDAGVRVSRCSGRARGRRRERARASVR